VPHLVDYEENGGKTFRTVIKAAKDPEVEAKKSFDHTGPDWRHMGKTEDVSRGHGHIDP
jgi:hypothetical protein